MSENMRPAIKAYVECPTAVDEGYLPFLERRYAELQSELTSLRAELEESQESDECSWRVLGWITKELLSGESVIFSTKDGRIQLLGEDCRALELVPQSEGENVYDCIKNLMHENGEWDRKQSIFESLRAKLEKAEEWVEKCALKMEELAAGELSSNVFTIDSLHRAAKELRKFAALKEGK